MKSKILPGLVKSFLVLAILFLAISPDSQAQTNAARGSAAYCHPVPAKKKIVKTKRLGLNRSVAQSTTIFSTDFVSAGVGGLRDIGTGQIALSGVSGTITRAYLYWSGVTNITTNVGGTILVNGTSVTGTGLGVSDNNCWGYNNSQAYRADVTALVRTTINGTYVLSGFGDLNPNGASLIVFFNDANSSNNRDVVIFDGNDSNIFFAGISGNPDAPEDPAGWNVLLSGIVYNGGAANIQLHVGDGQDFPDDALSINATEIAPAGGVFDGHTVPGANNGPGNNGNLWDIRSFVVTSFLTPGPNSLNLTTGTSSDCLGLIAALIDLPSGAAPVTEYYSKPAGDLHNVLSWGENMDGSGANPPDFTVGKTFHLVNRVPNYTLTANWTVGGRLDIPTGSQLRINGFTLSVADLIGAGSFSGTTASNLIITQPSTGNTTFRFVNSANSLNNLSVVSPTTTTLASSLNVYGVLTVQNGTFNTGNAVTLKSSATATARVAPVTGTVSGNVTVERYIPARRAWRILSAPVGGTQKISAAWQENATTFSAVPDPNPGFGTHITEGSTAVNGFDHNPLIAMASIKKYVSATNSWTALGNTNATNVNADAYLTFVRGHRSTPLGLNTVAPTNTTLRATGPLKTGDQAFNVSATGFTAIPNPFASPINFATLTRSNVQDNFYLWDPKLGGVSGVGGYVLLSSNGIGGYDITPAPVSPESQLIQSGQGFLVHSTGIGGTLVIKESDKSATAATNVFRAANSSTAPASVKGLRSSLQIVDADKAVAMVDEAFSSYGPAYSNNVDNMDPVKLANFNENLGLTRNGQSLMIERRQEFAGNDTINLQLWNTTQRKYRLQFNPVNLSSTILSGYLEDKYLQTVTPVNLNEATTVSFTIDENAASAGRDRFRVVLVSKKSLPEISSGKSGIRLANPISGDAINIQFINQPTGIYSITLFNNIGQQIYQGRIVHAGGSATQTLQLNKPGKGLYRMRVTNGDKKIASALPVLVN